MGLEKGVRSEYAEWVVHTDPFTANAYDGKKFYDVPLTAKLVVKSRVLKDGSIKNTYYFMAHYGNGVGGVRVAKRKLRDDYISREDEEKDVREKEAEDICREHNLNISSLEALLKSGAKITAPDQIARILGIKKQAAQRYANSLLRLGEDELEKISNYLLEKNEIETDKEKRRREKITYRQAYQEIVDALQDTGCCFAEVTPRGTIKTITFGV